VGGRRPPSGDPGAGKKLGAETEVRCAIRILIVSVLFILPRGSANLVCWKKKPRRRARCPSPWPGQSWRRKAGSVKRRRHRRHVAANLKRSLTLPTREKTSRRRSSGKAAMPSVHLRCLFAMPVATQEQSYTEYGCISAASSPCLLILTWPNSQQGRFVVGVRTGKQSLLRFLLLLRTLIRKVPQFLTPIAHRLGFVKLLLAATTT
jgi:hypothetical protein